MTVADHPDLRTLPSDEARWLWIVVLTRAKIQPEPGAFRSEAQLRGLLDKFQRRKLVHLFDTGLLERRLDGAVLVHNWAVWQSDGSPDVTHADRQRRYRLRVAAGPAPVRGGSAPGPVDGTLAGHGWSETEREMADVTAVSQPSRVTPSDGDPSLEGNATVTLALRGDAVTSLSTVAFGDPRRDLARAIREAPEFLKIRHLAAFERRYQCYPAGREQRNRRPFKAAVLNIVRAS